jgi:hypothetical protein
MKDSIPIGAANPPCQVTLAENRSIDGFDLIVILGLMKEYNRQEIWRRYAPIEMPAGTISMYVSSEPYFLEMHVQTMERIILSEKFNTNPFFMQQVVQRITAGHDHHLTMEKIRQQGIDAGYNPISLSCSMGNVIIDLIANLTEPLSEATESPHGNTAVETAEKRPLDIYDLSSTLYLCQQNLSDAIFRRYAQPDAKGGGGSASPEVNFSARVGEYNVDLNFHCISTKEERFIPPPGNASVSTIHQVLQRMNFRHSRELILKEMSSVGLSVSARQLETDFVLQRHINNTALKLKFKHLIV